jgi:hypothetical protein
MFRIDIQVQSAGYHAGNSAMIRLNGVSVGITGAGFNVVTLNPYNGLVLDMITYNTRGSADSLAHFCKFIHDISDETIVVISTKEDGVDLITSELSDALSSIGSSFCHRLKYRDSWCIIGIKGAPKGSVPESYRESFNGPTDILSKVIELELDDKDEEDFEFICKSSISCLMSSPCKGSWHRRRRIDGAVNRVPAQFYPKVWYVLEKFRGIRLHEGYLPRQPTVSEKTPEEVNFALVVEGVLDSVREPCDRYLVVEGLLSLHWLIEKLSSMNVEHLCIFKDIDLDVKKLVENAIRLCWVAYSEEQSLHLERNVRRRSSKKKKSPSSQPISGDLTPLSLPSRPDTAQATPNGKSEQETSPTAIQNAIHRLSISVPNNQDYNLDRNWERAREIFVDLPQEGPHSVMYFLNKSALESLPFPETMKNISIW